MIINGYDFKFIDTLNSSVTVPDCFVKPASKIGGGNGEAKLYIASKGVLYPFFGNTGFSAKCFLLKHDILSYMNALHAEYMNPSQPYRAIEVMPELWKERMAVIEQLPDVIDFTVHIQDQISGDRGYVNSKDFGYQLIREIALPLVSYISIMRLEDKMGSTIFYWKLFADFDAISDKKDAMVFTYGKKGERIAQPAPKEETTHQSEIRRARQGQGIYRERLLAECPFCPITMINDERLLIASHIKPWAVATDNEKIDHKNGFMLSPLYDKLFDRGFMTFTDDRRIVLSNWISPSNKKRLGIKDGQFVQMLPLDYERQSYMAFHRASVFKG
ncbi:MAG: HNH endonuclease [Muribaculaceae bacterium]|nr:HNH endonuclease [Muribaculaceae bacterium]MDE7142388.1 HNH endonuclease [Muribaculaceae bacterium]